MKKLIALFGSVALLSACTFTVTTEMNDDKSDDTVPAEEVVEEDGTPTEDAPAEEAPTEEAEAPAEEDDGTVDGETHEDSGGDGTNTTGGDNAAVEVEVEAEAEVQAESE